MKYKRSAKTRRLMSQKRKEWWNRKRSNDPRKVFEGSFMQNALPLLDNAFEQCAGSGENVIERKIEDRKWVSGSYLPEDLKISYSWPFNPCCVGVIGTHEPTIPMHLKPIKLLFKKLRAITALFNKSSGDDKNEETK